MNHDNRIINRTLDIYYDLAHYTNVNQMQTNDTLQRIESGIRELNTYVEDMYHGNIREERISRNPPESSPLFTNDRTVPIIRNIFNPRQPVNNRPSSVNNRPSSVNNRPTYVNNRPSSVNNRPSSVNNRPSSVNNRPSSVNNRPSSVNYRTPTNTRRVNPNTARPVTSNNITDNGARINQLSNNDFFNQFFNMFNTDLNNLTPVTVRPTSTQIVNATEIISINENMVNAICPILQTTFQDGDRISRIKQCGHCFIEEGLMVWFNQNVRCPVCRYDIRDYPIEPTPVVPVEPMQRSTPVAPRNTRDLSNNIINSTNDRENTTSTNRDNNLMDIFTNQIPNTFQQYLTDSDVSFNNESISVEYFVQTPTSIYTTSTPSRLFSNYSESRNNETLEYDDEEVEDVEDVVMSDDELFDDEYITE